VNAPWAWLAAAAVAVLVIAVIGSYVFSVILRD